MQQLKLIFSLLIATYPIGALQDRMIESIGNNLVLDSVSPFLQPY
jgi:hypothetical protein